MSGESGVSKSRRSNNRGKFVAGAGCVFGLAPLIVSFIALLFGSGIGNVLHWYTLVTAPIGVCVVVVGLVMTIKESHDRRTASNSSDSGDIDHEFVRSIRSKFTVGAAIAAGIAIVGLAFPVGGDSISVQNIVVIIAAFAIGFSARKIKSKPQFDFFHLVQLVGSIAVIVSHVGLLIGLAVMLTMFVQGMDPDLYPISELIGIAVGVLAMGLAVSSLVYTAKIRDRVGSHPAA